MRWYYVYVVELRPIGNFQDVYVGSSALIPSIRFKKHLSGEKSSKHVRNRGIKLLPQYYESLNPCYSRQEAKRKELYLRRKLEKKGFRVFGSCLKRESDYCRF